MADPRFYDNRGPLKLADLCGRIGAQLPAGANGDTKIDDVATLEGAGPTQLAFCIGKSAKQALSKTQAGACLITADMAALGLVPSSTVAVVCASPQHAFAAAARSFYLENGLASWPQKAPIDPSARVGKDAVLGPGVVVGPLAEIGERTRIGPNTVIGRGVAIGRDCEIGSNVTITHAYVGDGVLILPGAQIGSPGFGFASSAKGHEKIPQLGRVIIQDKVEVGACSTIDRGAIGDTVIGEGTKIDNLVQIGHNTRIGRHCIIVSQVGISGSCDLGDFVVLGGQAGLADHVKIGDGARLAGRTGVFPGELAGGQDYGGVPARPVKEWLRDMAVAARQGKKSKNG
ncbi:MAG: UDP-3-O-(3-hydroxymyristoyl)glucosamine N-acyltransferase [Proteobacteria bacterium]|nr:UDP-3-O-(3-hydroxymyristoyl)glucosamine N-acyltransferase [Pseudomonadota bacterium]